ncbi:MAG: FAD-binding oxidoreductase [Lentimicrobium sp.]|nr:FAD-binding oxidoreductase [Lentimicrobium sp.]
MSHQKVLIQHREWITHDVLQIRTERPRGFNFIPGQATELSVDKPGFQSEKRPFTFTNIPNTDFLEFAIKIYSDHNGVTKKISELNPGDILLLHGVFGAIHYKGEGTFIAGGAGVTPFISILRTLKYEGKLKNNSLLFANKTRRDIILKEEFESMLGNNFINILSEEAHPDYAHGMISQHFIGEHMHSRSRPVYVCGPQPMIKMVVHELSGLGVPLHLLVKEEF